MINKKPDLINKLYLKVLNTFFTNATAYKLTTGKEGLKLLIEKNKAP